MRVIISNSVSAFEALKAGKEEGLNFFFDAYYTALNWYALKLVKDGSLAEDLVAEALAKLWTKRESLQHAAAVRSFLYTTVRNAAADLGRRTKPAGKYLNEAAFLANAAEDPLRFETEAELYRRLYAAVQTLPAQAGRVLQMHLDGLSYKEIADSLGISEKTVRNQKLRAVDLLRQRLVKHSWLWVGVVLLSVLS